MRQIVLDTETTGLEVTEGHRIIEIGAVEIVNRRITDNVFHHYLCPDREIDAGAIEVHGITLQELQNKPRFAEIAEEFLEFIKDSELIIHNAPFDIGFLNAELAMVESGLDAVEHYCSNIFDTLPFARQLHPAQRNSLDALCKRYEIDNSQRELHGALLDAQILADVYLAMTGGQTSLGLADRLDTSGGQVKRKMAKRPAAVLSVIKATEEELTEHEKMLKQIAAQSEDGVCIWNS